ncbi:MAG: F0F1-type ATP synthase gamma subunit [Candidatus Omnitrophota bacterium]|jgi:F0F1-type ATP synthase gamma subunit
MSQLPKIQEEMDLMSDMRSIMEVMKSIALTGFIDSKKLREQRYEYFNKSFDGFFQVADLTHAEHPFIKAASSKVCIIAVTSSESFMAGLNNRVMKLAFSKTEGLEKHFIITGPRMMGKLKNEGIAYTMFPGIKIKNMVDIATQIKDFVLQKVLDKEFGRVVCVFAYPESISKQEVRAVTLIPAESAYPEEMKASIIDPDEEVFIESEFDNLMMHLNELWLISKLIHTFQDHKMSEGAAQAMQLDGNLENLMDYEKKLKMAFVKTRREVIDTSLRETVSAMMAAPQH